MALVSQQSLTQHWLCNASLEIVPNVANKYAESLNQQVKPNQFIYVTFLPTATIQSILTAVDWIQKAQGIPVVHIPARHFIDYAHLKNFACELINAHVQHILLLAGDRRDPLGEFASSLDLLDTGLFNQAFKSVGFAAHPEGHPAVNRKVLQQSMLKKQQWAQAYQINAYFITQFVLDAKKVIVWLKKTQQQISLPIYLGLPGIVTTKQLLTFSRLAGVSWWRLMTLLVRSPWRWLRLMGSGSPLKSIQTLSSSQKKGHIHIQGLHFYTFGGFKKTTEWLNQQE